MYVAVKGGERAIDAAHGMLDRARRGDPKVPEISLDQISEQLALSVDRANRSTRSPSNWPCPWTG